MFSFFLKKRITSVSWGNLVASLTSIPSTWLPADETVELLMRSALRVRVIPRDAIMTLRAWCWMPCLMRPILWGWLLGGMILKWIELAGSFYFLYFLPFVRLFTRSWLSCDRHKERNWSKYLPDSASSVIFAFDLLHSSNLNLIGSSIISQFGFGGCFRWTVKKAEKLRMRYYNRFTFFFDGF
jgi:hypothetical protein